METKAERNERSSPLPASWQFCCIISGSAARHTNRSTTRRSGDWLRHSSEKAYVHHKQTPSSGDCVLGQAPAPSQMEREGVLTDGSADCIENTQCAPSA